MNYHCISLIYVKIDENVSIFDQNEVKKNHNSFENLSFDENQQNICLLDRFNQIKLIFFSFHFHLDEMRLLWIDLLIKWNNSCGSSGASNKIASSDTKKKWAHNDMEKVHQIESNSLMKRIDYSLFFFAHEIVFFVKMALFI